MSPVSSRGWPDRVFIDPDGHHIYLELKAPGKKPRKLQIYRMDCLKERGVEVHWKNDLEQAMKILDDNLGLDEHE